ncbi:MAG: helix-turn-helix domain-containing protein [Pseudomonadota bacterium]
MQHVINHDALPRPATPAEVIVLTTRQAASYLGLSVSTLNKWRCYGFGPKYLKLGRAVRYQQQELDRYLAGRLYQSTLGN